MKRNLNPVWAILVLATLGFAAESAAATATHQVVRRDTLSRIALRYCGVMEAYRDIATENGIRNPNLIHPGQRLTISCAAKQAASVVRVKPVGKSVSHVATAQVTAAAVAVESKDLQKALRRGYTVAVPQPGSNTPAFVGPHAEEVRELFHKTVDYGSEPSQNPEAYELEVFACGIFGVDSDCAVYLAITRSENDKRSCKGRSPLNTNGSFDIGFPQLTSNHVSRFPQFDFTDCKEAIMASYLLYRQDRGFGGWTNYKNGRYRQFLPHYQRFAARLKQDLVAAATGGGND